MSVAIATMGLFTPAVPSSPVVVSGGGAVMRIEDQPKKPSILVKSVYEKDKKKYTTQEFITVKSIKNGD